MHWWKPGFRCWPKGLCSEVYSQLPISYELPIRADEPFNSWRPCISSGCVASMERPTRVSQDCSVLDVILPAAQDVPVPQQLLLTLFLWPLNALMFSTPHIGPSVTFLMTMLSAPVTLFFTWSVTRIFSSQCSTVVRNTVVRAVQKWIGKRRFWTPVAP